MPPAVKEDYTTRSLEIWAREGVDRLFPGSDPELLPLSRIKHELQKELDCRIIVADEVCIWISRNKLETYRFCKERALFFAETVALDGLEGLVDRNGFSILASPLTVRVL